MQFFKSAFFLNHSASPTISDKFWDVLFIVYGYGQEHYYSILPEEA